MVLHFEHRYKLSAPFLCIGALEPKFLDCVTHKLMGTAQFERSTAEWTLVALHEILLQVSYPLVSASEAELVLAICALVRVHKEQVTDLTGDHGGV